MKIKLAILASLVSASAGFGQTLSINNLAGFDFTSALPIFDNSGAAIAASDLTITAGVFSSEANAELDGFIPFPSTGSITNNNTGNFIDDALTFSGPAEGAGSLEDIGGFVGESIFIVLESTAGEIGIFESGNPVVGNTLVPGGSPFIGNTLVEISTDGGTVAVGTLIPDAEVPGVGTFANGFGLVAIPEPSVSLLAGLALLGGLARRRR